MDKLEHQRNHFEKVSQTYLLARQNKNHLMLKKLLWEYFFADKKDILSDGAQVLEPMCGYSEGKSIIETFCNPKIVYVGFDYSRPLVEEARLRYPGLDITVQDVTKFETTRQYEMIIIIGGLHHVYAHTGEVLARLTKALKIGGYFINFEPTQDNFIFRFIRKKIYERNPIFDEQTEQAYDLMELNRLYQKAGFEVVDQIYPGLISYVLFYNPDAFPILNIGNTGLVKLLFMLEKKLFRTWFARKFSFATLSLLKKVEPPCG